MYNTSCLYGKLVAAFLPRQPALAEPMAMSLRVDYHLVVPLHRFPIYGRADVQRLLRKWHLAHRDVED